MWRSTPASRQLRAGASQLTLSEREADIAVMVGRRTGAKPRPH